MRFAAIMHGCMPVFLLMGNYRPATAQCSVSTSETVINYEPGSPGYGQPYSYTVHAEVVPNGVVAAGSSCANGYDYEISFHYRIYYTGTNIPAKVNILELNRGFSCSNGYSGYYTFDRYTYNGSGIQGSAVTTNGQSTSSADCAAASLGTLGCGKSPELTVKGPGIPYSVLNCIAVATLPVQLTGFTATATQAGVLLQWTTGMEAGNRYFSIERSTDGQRWQEIGRVAGAGTSETVRRYSTTDAVPAAGTNHYRLKQTDVDGRSAYAAVATVRTGIATMLSLSPNPSRGNIVRLTGLAAGESWCLQLTSGSGAPIGTPLPVQGAEARLPSLPAGLYFLRLTEARSGRSGLIRYMQL